MTSRIADPGLSASNHARRLWEAIEPLHAVVYFDPEVTAATSRVGLRGFWMSYFAGRFAPMGPVPSASVTAMAFGFAPSMVARSIPDAWSFAEPDEVLDARMTAAAESLRHHLDRRSVSDLAKVTDAFWEAVGRCRFEGRPLAAAWSQVPRPGSPLAAVWLAATVFREHRGDGHVLAAVGEGLSGLDTTLTLVATGAITREVIQPSRGWTDDEWDASTRRLVDRGLLDESGHLTDDGRDVRRQVEAVTDRLASAAIDGFEPTEVERIIEVAAAASRSLVDGGLIPIPNPIGAPRPAD